MHITFQHRDRILGLGTRPQTAEDTVNFVPQPANDRSLAAFWTHNRRLLDWLNRLTEPELSFTDLIAPPSPEKVSVALAGGLPLGDDWQIVTSLCGYTAQDFQDAHASLPLTAAEADHFRRNHRGTENLICRDFLAAKMDLPSPLGELYGLYLHRARADAEAALFVAQTTGSTRVAHMMADLLAIGAFANGLESIGHLGLIYSVPAAFDTADMIDRANAEALRRLALPSDHPAHLLAMTPDEIAVLAANIVEKHALAPSPFLDKANLLAESRQDVTRLPTSQHFTTAIIERDIPTNEAWGTRLCAAFARVLGQWVTGLPEAEPALS